MKDSSLRVPLLSESDNDESKYSASIDLPPMTEQKSARQPTQSWDSLIGIIEEDDEEINDDEYDEDAITQFIADIQQNSEDIEKEVDKETEAGTKIGIEIEAVEAKEENNFQPILTNVKDSSNEVKRCGNSKLAIWAGTIGELSLIGVVIWAWYEYTYNCSVMSAHERSCPGFAFLINCGRNNFTLCDDFSVNQWCSNNGLKEIHFNIGIYTSVLFALSLPFLIRSLIKYCADHVDLKSTHEEKKPRINFFDQKNAIEKHKISYEEGGVPNLRKEFSKLKKQNRISKMEFATFCTFAESISPKFLAVTQQTVGDYLGYCDLG